MAVKILASSVAVHTDVGTETNRLAPPNVDDVCISSIAHATES